MTPLSAGATIRGVTRCMTRERMRWYVDVLHSLAENDGRLHADAEANIHSGDAFARNEGLPGVVADGPISTNWLFGLLVDTFGQAVLGPIRLSTKHVRPTLEGQMVTPCLCVTAAMPDANETRYETELWCEDEAGVRLTVGAATLTVSG